MKKLASLFVALFSLVWLTGAGWLPLTKSGGCSATFVLDGSNTINTTATTNVTNITTANGCGVIVVGSLANAGISTVVASGLTFTLRSAINGSGNFAEEWTAPYITNFSGNITITYSAATFSTVSSWGISGTRTSSFFDGAAQTSISGPPPITTANANDFIYSLCSTGGTNTAGSGWTLINGLNFQATEYQIVFATQTALTPTFTSGTGTVCITDAIVKGP